METIKVKTFKLSFEGIKVGFFSDSVFSGAELIEAVNLTQAWERAERRAKQQSIQGRIVFVVKDLEELPNSEHEIEIEEPSKTSIKYYVPNNFLTI